MYQTGVANSTQDLLAKIGTFAGALNWTVLVNDSTFQITQGEPNLGRLIVQNPAGDSFWELIAGPSPNNKACIGVSPFTSYDNTAGPFGQPGNALGVPHAGTTLFYQSINYMLMPITAYWLFGTAQYIHLVVEHQPGNFRHLHIGTLNKRCTFTGGQYAAVSQLDDESSAYWTSPWLSFDGAMPWDAGAGPYSKAATVVRADADGLSPGWRWACDNSYQTPNGAQRILTRIGGDDDICALLGVQPSQYNQLSVGVPIMVEVGRTGTTLSFSPVGEVLDVRAIKYGNYAPAQIQTIGDDQWIVFPVLGIPGAGNPESDQGYGLMYRIVN